MDAIRTNEIEKQYQDIEKKNGIIGQQLNKPMEALKSGYHENAVSLCGSILQSILKDMWQRENIPGDPEIQNPENLLEGVKDRIQDQLIKKYLDEVMSISLKADRGDHLKMEDAFEMLRKLCSVVMWYLTKYSYENLKRRVIPVRRVVALISLVFVFSVVSSSFVTHSFLSRSSGSKPTGPLAIAKTSTQIAAPIDTQNDGQESLTDQDWIAIGVRQGNNRDWNGAIDSFTQALQINNSYNTYVLRAAVYVNKGYYEKALADCNEAIKLNPDHGYAYHVRGTAFARTNQIEKAKKDLMKGCYLRYTDACESYEKMTGQKISVEDKENSMNR